MTHPPPGTDLENLLFVGFDTETTGLSPVASRLIELSAVKFCADGSVVSTFSQLIDPESSIPSDATAVHGITDEMVQGQPTYHQVLLDFLDWLEGENVVLVAHNASFDLGFLEVAFARLCLEAPDYPVVDTLNLCRRLVPNAPNHKLRTLTEHLGLEVGSYHRALADSYHVKDLLLRMLKLMGACRTWRDVAEACGVLRFTNPRELGYAQIEVMPKGFESIGVAISQKLPISLTYNNGSTSRRIVTPHSVHSLRGSLYLSAFCHSAQAERSFRLDKIVGLKVVKAD